MSVNAPIRVSFMIEVEDLVAYIRLLQHRLNMLAVILGVAIMIFGSVIATLLADPLTGMFTLVVGGLLVFLAGTEFLDRWRVRRSGSRLLGETAAFKFDESGIRPDAGTGTDKVEWSDVTELLRNRRVLILKRGRNPLVWIPTRAFVTPEDERALIDFIEAHIGRGGGGVAAASEARAS